MPDFVNDIASRNAIVKSVEKHAAELYALSQFMYDNPEIAFQEHLASSRIIEMLSSYRYAITSPVAGLDTAFVARIGSGSLKVGICAEYDALKNLGHACGHNIIAASAVGAARVLAPLVDALDIEVVIIGTPAEEGGGGKIILADNHIFDELTYAMMVHPGPGIDVIDKPMVAADHFTVRYFGKSAHASAGPHLGINAADALHIAQTAIALHRQQMLPDQQVHGISTYGGDAPNIIPEFVQAEYATRGSTSASMYSLTEAIERCFQAGALATRSRLEISRAAKPYLEMRHNALLVDCYKEALDTINRPYAAPGSVQQGGGSTDMGNISHMLPAIHPHLGLGNISAINHQREFADATTTSAGKKAIVDGASSLALTVISTATNPTIRSELANYSTQESRLSL